MKLITFFGFHFLKLIFEILQNTNEKIMLFVLDIQFKSFGEVLFDF